MTRLRSRSSVIDVTWFFSSFSCISGSTWFFLTFSWYLADNFSADNSSIYFFLSKDCPTFCIYDNIFPSVTFLYDFHDFFPVLLRLDVTGKAVHVCCSLVFKRWDGTNFVLFVVWLGHKPQPKLKKFSLYFFKIKSWIVCCKISGRKHPQAKSLFRITINEARITIWLRCWKVPNIITIETTENITDNSLVTVNLRPDKNRYEKPQKITIKT